MSAQISVPDDVKKVLDQLAKERGETIGDAVSRMVRVATSRLNALRNYAKKQKTGGSQPKKAAKEGKGKK